MVDNYLEQDIWYMNRKYQASNRDQSLSELEIAFFYKSFIKKGQSPGSVSGSKKRIRNTIREAEKDIFYVCHSGINPPTPSSLMAFGT